MNPRDSPGYDIGPDVDRRGMHGNRISRPAVRPSSDLDADDLEEDTPTMESIRWCFPEGVFESWQVIEYLDENIEWQVIESLDESIDPPLSYRQNSTENGFIYQNSHHMSDSSLDEVARGTSPWVSEAVRLNSFYNWPYHTVIPSIRPEDLAKDGFRYVGPMDTVQCVFCRQRLKHWEEGDTVRGEHQRFKQNCPMLCGQGTQNVPIATDEERSAILQSHVSRPRQTERQVFRGEQPREEEMSLEAPRAKYPQFSVEATRLETYKDWPTQMNQKPDQLSKAGFFYLNRGDIVCCFFCGETVMEWEKEDDAWVEHAKISPNCYFVKMVKGEEFIQMAKEGGANKQLFSILEKLQALHQSQQAIKEVLHHFSTRQEEILEKCRVRRPSMDTRYVEALELPPDVREFCDRIQYFIGGHAKTFGQRLLGRHFHVEDFECDPGTYVCFATVRVFWQLIRKWWETADSSTLTLERLQYACSDLTPNPTQLEPMSALKQERLEIHFPFLVDNVQVGKTLVALRGSGKLSEDARMYVQQGASQDDRMDRLVCVLQSLGDPGFQLFLQALDSSQQFLISRRLTSGFQEEGLGE